MGWFEPIAASGDLCGVLSCRYVATAAGRHDLIPDGSMDLLWIEGVGTVLCGPDTRSWSFELPPGTEVAGVRFRPGAATGVFRLEAADIRDLRVELADVLGDADDRILAERLDACDDPVERMGVLEDLVRRRTREADPDGMVELAALVATDPAYGAEGLAAQAGMSSRQLRRRFNRTVGYGPAFFARITRLQRFAGDPRRLRRPAAPGQGLPSDRRHDAPPADRRASSMFLGDDSWRRPIGTRRSGSRCATIGGMNSIADRYRNLADALERRIATVRSDQWSNQSPCEEWTAGEVVGHLIEVHGMMLGAIGRQLTPAPSVDDDPMAAFQAARTDVQAVLDDSEVAATEYDGAFGRTNIESTIDQFLGFDLVVHGWDLARATGQDETIDQAEVERIWSSAQVLGDNLRTPGVCGPAVEVPDDAPLQDKLLGFLGRDPR